MVCANCGYEILPDKSICLNCGQPVGRNKSWPPAPTNAFPMHAIDTRKLITGNRSEDIWLGFTITLMSGALGIGLIVMPVLYFAFQEQYPTFRRGIGFGLLSLALILGIFAILLAINIGKNPWI